MSRPIAYLVIMMSLLLCQLSRANPAACTERFRVGLNFSAVGKDKNDLARLAEDLWVLLQKRMPCQYSPKYMSFQRGEEALAGNLLDIYAFTYESPQILVHSEAIPLYQTKKILLVNKGEFKKGFSVADYVNKSKVKFAAHSAGHYMLIESELRILKNQGRLVYDPYPLGTLEILKKKFADATVTSATFYLTYKDSLQIESFARVIPLEDDFNLAVVLSKNRVPKATRDKFREVILSMQKDGSIQEILKKYLPPNDYVRVGPSR